MLPPFFSAAAALLLHARTELFYIYQKFIETSSRRSLLCQEKKKRESRSHQTHFHFGVYNKSGPLCDQNRMNEKNKKEGKKAYYYGGPCRC